MQKKLEETLARTLADLNETMQRIEAVLAEYRPLPTNLTVQQAAEELNVSADLIYAACNDGALRHCRYGKGRGTIRIKRADLAAWDERCVSVGGDVDFAMLREVGLA